MGIFANQTNVFTVYQARLLFKDRIMGGTPKDPKIIEGWLRSRAGVNNDDEILQAIKRTLQEQGVDVTDGQTYEEMVAASAGLAANKQTNGFKFDENGLYIEGRVVKAMLKECTNILYPYGVDKWTVTQKAPRSALAERVFVDADRIYLGVKEPTGIEMFVGHVTGPQGPHSTLTYYEYVERAEITFDVRVAEDLVSEQQWGELWTLAEQNGLGALRSQGFGRFDIEAWACISAGRSLPQRKEPSDKTKLKRQIARVA